jgi:hypothetical protein
LAIFHFLNLGPGAAWPIIAIIQCDLLLNAQFFVRRLVSRMLLITAGMAPGITAALAEMAVGAGVLFRASSPMRRRLIDLFETSHGNEAMIIHQILAKRFFRHIKTELCILVKAKSRIKPITSCCWRHCLSCCAVFHEDYPQWFCVFFVTT